MARVSRTGQEVSGSSTAEGLDRFKPLAEDRKRVEPPDRAGDGVAHQTVNNDAAHIPGAPAGLPMKRHQNTGYAYLVLLPGAIQRAWRTSSGQSPRHD